MRETSNTDTNAGMFKLEKNEDDGVSELTKRTAGVHKLEDAF